MDSLEDFKAIQKEGWANFAPLVETLTTAPAARLIKFARLCPGQKVLDVACGTGVVSITAARKGAKVTGLDLAPELLNQARHNAGIADVQVEWREGDVEELPFRAEEFDVILSQFGHIFAPRHTVALAEMLRVLKPGGTIAFSTWPPELFMGRMFALVSDYKPAAPAGVLPSWLWGDQKVVQERFGNSVTDIVYDMETILCPSLSVQHFRNTMEQAVAPVTELVESVRAKDPGKLATFRRAYDALVNEFFDENAVRLTYMLTRGRKN